ncbi:nif-specific transcriptional activator NifA [Candidatus Macondimonas diazotrophica]|uniref:nif-specific transcriptional activator NifA n=1 Tax=Candidatus Macondimonas diazotrophica TaxID=2305248 RepID=UPI001F0E9AA9|nr:nif-specific transcriptional activator NifA [Candidatus Macondimonas diazotrophica]
MLTIYEISKVLGSSLDLQRTVREVVTILSTHLGGRAMVSLLQESGDLQILEASGLTAEEKARGRFKLGEGITGKIMTSAMPMVVPDISLEPLFLHRTGAHQGQTDEVVAFIGVPILVGRDAIGVLSIARGAARNVSVRYERIVRLLKMAANLIGQTAHLHQHIGAERASLMADRNRLQKQLQGKYRLDNVIGVSKAMQEVFSEVHQVAASRSTVLLRGESGTGKEVIARAVHYLSPRRERPFVSLNCAALSETLLESELFGHEKGSFTGATTERKGRFELAHGGTLFLDEIGEISPAFQTKLLRVLQEREFERVGGTKPIHVDVRLICATNKNLEEAVSKGEFRADLYFRINVVTIFLPPLRDRREDIPLLSQHFLEKFNRENDRGLMLSPEALKIMLECNWPGNVRELENCVERAATMTQGDIVRAPTLACQHNRCFSLVLQSYGTAPRPFPIEVVPAPIPSTAAPDRIGPLDEFGADELGRSGLPDRERLIQALEQSGWVQAKAARLLSLTPRQIGYAIRKHGIEVKRF